MIAKRIGISAILWSLLAVVGVASAQVLEPVSQYYGKWPKANYVNPSILGNGIDGSKLLNNSVLPGKLAAGISALLIGPGSVDNTEFGYLNGVTSSVQTQINAVNAALAGYVALTGDQVIAGIKTFSSPPVMSGGAITAATIANASLANSTFSFAQPVAGLTVTASAALGGTVTFALADDLAQLEGLAGTGFATRNSGTWTQRSIVSGTGTTVSNGDGTGNPAVNVTYGTGSNTATQGNDVRLPPAPSGAGGTYYDTGAAIARLGAGVANQLYQSNGAAAPSWTSAPTVSGANITPATIPLSALDGGTIGTLPIDNGTGFQGLPPGTANYLLMSQGAGLTLAYTNTLTGIQISGSTNTISNLPTSSIAAAFLLPVANGGTGLASYTAGSLLYASASTTIAQITPGAANTVLTSNGTVPGYAALPTASSGTSVLGGTFTLTAASGTYESTGLSVALPSAGTYLITGNITGAVSTSSGAGTIKSYLYNATTAAIVANSERLVVYTGVSLVLPVENASVSIVITVAAANTITLYVARVGTTTASYLQSDADTRTSLSYVKLSN